MIQISETSPESWKTRLFYAEKGDDRSRMRAVANNLILHMEVNWLINQTTGQTIQLRTSEGLPVWNSGN